MSFISPGDKLTKPSASQQNAIMRAAQKAKAFDPTGEVGIGASRIDYDTLRIQNKAGEAVDEFRALVIDHPVVTPTANEQEFERNHTWQVKKASAAKQAFGVTQGMLDTDRFGVMVISGQTLCRINLLSVGDTGCDVVAGSVIPQSSSSGVAQILWVAGGAGTATATGEQLALIKLGGGGAASLPSGQYAGQAFEMVSNNQAGMGTSRVRGVCSKAGTN